jgi:hypothetical protein
MLAAVAGVVSARGKSGRKPNLLFLIADDHAGYVLGADGNRLAHTPNIDRLASQGMRFARNHCNSPVCTPSRVMREGMAVALAGIAVGLAGAFALKRALATLLFGVEAHDPATFTLVACVLAAVALAACLLPAYRAARIDPVIALREE